VVQMSRVVAKQLGVMAASEEIGVSRQLVQRWVGQGRIAATQISGIWVIDMSEVERVRRERRAGTWPTTPRAIRGHL